MDEEMMNELENEQVETVAQAAEDSADNAGGDEGGNVKISIDVVSTIAGIATNEINGVAGMYGTFAGGIAEMLGAKKSPSKGVRVDMNDGNVTIDLYIVVEYGVRIPELAWEIQENVKNNVETMTGLNVLKVNIHIEGVSFAKETESKDEKEHAEEVSPADDDNEEITD